VRAMVLIAAPLLVACAARPATPPAPKPAPAPPPAPAPAAPEPVASAAPEPEPETPPPPPKKRHKAHAPKPPSEDGAEPAPTPARPAVCSPNQFLAANRCFNGPDQACEALACPTQCKENCPTPCAFLEGSPIRVRCR
jgi:hypothetical protein